jgi:hypothetical protein
MEAMTLDNVVVVAIGSISSFGFKNLNSLSVCRRLLHVVL